MYELNGFKLSHAFPLPAMDDMLYLMRNMSGACWRLMVLTRSLPVLGDSMPRNCVQQTWYVFVVTVWKVGKRLKLFHSNLIVYLLGVLCQCQQLFVLIISLWSVLLTGFPRYNWLVITSFHASDWLLIPHVCWISDERQMTIRLNVQEYLSLARGSNQQPLNYKPDAPPIELILQAVTLVSISLK